MFNGLKALPAQLEAFNISLKSNRPVKVGNDADKDTTEVRFYLIEVQDNEINKAINDLFFLTRKSACMTLDPTD